MCRSHLIISTGVSPCDTPIFFFNRQGIDASFDSVLLYRHHENRATKPWSASRTSPYQEGGLCWSASVDVQKQKNSGNPSPAREGFLFTWASACLRHVRPTEKEHSFFGHHFMFRWMGGSVMADTRFLNALSDQVLIQRFKQFSGIDRDLVLRVLKQRFNRGSLKADLPSSLRQALKDKV